MIKVAILGKPNVGKSSLFNRLSHRRDAITSDVAGTTRDIKKSVIEIDDGKEIEIIDTGGIDDSTELFSKVKDKSLSIAKKADIILYMIDGKNIVDDEDKKLFYELQKLDKDIALVINKIDNDKEFDDGWRFKEFGTKNLFLISVSHNRGVNSLTKWIGSFIESELVIEEDIDEFLEDIIEEKITTEDSNSINIAIIGRVNVGKSSLLNALVGEDRAVVSDVAGTTIDPVDESFYYKNNKITVVDTAGVRRRGQIEGIEKFALDRTEKALKKADIAILVLDASEEFKELDEKIAGFIDEYNLASIIVLNKWDKSDTEFKKATQKVKDRFRFLENSPILAISATTKRNIEKLKDKILEIYANYTQRIPTAKLNEILSMAMAKHQLPSDKGRSVKIYYGTQFASKPPKIALIMNRPENLHFSYKRYLVNSFREHFNFEGCPIVMVPRKRGGKEEEK